MKKRKYRQSGQRLLSAVLPLARAAWPFVSKAALSGAVGLGASSVLRKIFGGGRGRKKKTRKLYRQRVYRRYVR